MNTRAITFTLRICRHSRTGDLYAMVVDQDGAITDVAGPLAVSSGAFRAADCAAWVDHPETLDWAEQQPWELVETIALEGETSS